MRRRLRPPTVTKQTRAGALTLLALTGLTLGSVLTAPAGATPRTGFLSAADLPPHPSSSWTAGDITDEVRRTVERDLDLEEARLS